VAVYMIYEALSSSKTNVTKEYRTKKFKLINTYCYIYWSKEIQDIKKTLKINLKSGGKTLCEYFFSYVCHDDNNFARRWCFVLVRFLVLAH